MAGKRLPTFVRRKIEDRERWLHRRQALGLPDYQPPSREEIEAREGSAGGGGAAGGG